MSEQPTPQPPPGDGKVLGWLNAVKGLTLTNVLVIILLAVVAVPIYVIYRALDDEALLDRFMSTYEEISSQQVGCTIRHAQARGGPATWGISTGFAFQGADRYVLSVVLDRQPTDAEMHSYCAALKLIVDNMGQETP